MKLQLTSYHKDIFPACGFFIEATSLTEWLDAIHQLDIDPLNIEIHALPSNTVNQIWGCLVLVDSPNLREELGKYQSAHIVGGKLIIPEKSKVLPELIEHDIQQLFQMDTYVLHPEFGLFKLTEPIKLAKHLDIGELHIIESSRPEDYSIWSAAINSFRIEATPKEELKYALEHLQEREKFEDQPLSISEKLRLEIYKKFINLDKDGEISLEGSALEKIAENLNLSGSNMRDRILKDFKNLLDRNKREVEKLLELMKDNPEEALRYAIPLEEHGYTTGDSKAEFKMKDRGLDFSLFGGLISSSRGAGGGIDIGDEYFRLRDQYLESAKKLKEKGAYEKAAYIYLKLLKNYQVAGETLREGKHFEKAALVFLKYFKNEQLAAECYEEGKIYKEAIELYKKLNKLEKVGDLYQLLGSRKSANKAYRAQIDKDLESNKYVKAANISKDKMQNLSYAQQLLLLGWTNRIDQYNCLRNYLDNIPDAKEVWKQIEKINREDVNNGNDLIFLKVLKEEYSNHDENEKKIKDLAYVLVSELLEKGKISSHELLSFNRADDRLPGDTMRYELKKNKRLTE